MDTMMDKQVKEKWLKALRSGRYKQGRNSLASKIINPVTYRTIASQYRCLGVLCKINRVLNEDGSLKSDPHQDCELGPLYRKRFKITKRQQDRLIALNDEGGYTFKEIADYIEKKL